MPEHARVLAVLMLAVVAIGSAFSAWSKEVEAERLRKQKEIWRKHYLAVIQTLTRRTKS